MADTFERVSGISPTAGVMRLAAGDRRALAEAIREAQEHQEAALEAAIEKGFGFIPRVLRGVVTKALFR